MRLPLAVSVVLFLTVAKSRGPSLIQIRAFCSPTSGSRACGFARSNAPAYAALRRIESRKTRHFRAAGNVNASRSPLPPLSLRLQRYGVVAGLILGYAFYYVCRYSLTFAGPALAAQEGLDIKRIGLLVSIGQISVGFSKIGGSILTADTSPSRCLVIGMVLTALFNIGAAMIPKTFSESGYLILCLGLIWSFNGLWQGFGSPACARIIDSWVPPKDRGTYWAVWNTSNNLGGALAPIIVGAGLAYGGWRTGLLCAGVSTLLMALAVLGVVKDEPASFSKSPETDNRATETKKSKEQREDDGDNVNADELQGWELFWHGCALQPGIMRLACANFLIYTIRAGIVSWFAFFALHQGHVSAAVATSLVSAFELGGLFGSVAGGLVSDRRMQQNPSAPIVGLRLDTVSIAVAAVLTPAVLALCLLPDAAGAISYSVILFAAGFGLYVAQALAALCGMELVPRRAIGVSQGFLGWTAYFGASCAGLPLGLLIQGAAGWNAWRFTLVLCCIGVLAMIVPLRKMPSRIQRFAGRNGNVVPVKGVSAQEWPRSRREKEGQ